MTEATPPPPAAYQPQDSATDSPEQPTPAPASYATVPQPPAQKRPRTLLRVGIGLVVVVIAVVVYLVLHHNSPDNASVGNCMSGVTADTLKITDCSNSDAKWTVVGKVTTKKEPSAADAATDCTPFPTAGADYYKDGYVLCLAPKN